MPPAPTTGSAAAPRCRPRSRSCWPGRRRVPEPPELVDDLKELARLLVDKPDEVEVQEVPSRRGGGVLELKVAPDDLGKVIGRQGRTARAMRTLLETREDRRGGRVELRILRNRKARR